MVVQIKCFHTGLSVDFAPNGMGVLVGHAGGYHVYVWGDKPKGYSLNQVLASCLPHITQLTGVPARHVTYENPTRPTRPKKVDAKQKPLF